MTSETDHEPPDAPRVAKRALVLAAVACRSFSDHDPTNPDAIDLWERLKDWIESQDLNDEIEAQERALICAPLGSLSEKDRINGSWRAEGLAILAWALDLFPFPRHDQQVDAYELTDSIAFLNPEASNIVKGANLRPRAEKSACRELYYALHCRLRGFAREKSPRDIRHWIATDWIDVLGTDPVLDESGDLNIQGTPISRASAEAISVFESITYERHRAAIWLAGESESQYSAVTVDT